MTDRTSALNTRLGALWADTTILPPPLSISLRRSLIMVTVILMVIGTIEVKALARVGPFSVLLVALYLVGGLCAYSLQFIDDARRLFVIYSVGLAAIAMLFVVHLSMLALAPLQFTLLFAFYRFPLRRALWLGAIPMLFATLLAYMVGQQAVKVNTAFTMFAVFFISIVIIVAGITRRQYTLTNRHLTWTREQLDREMARTAHLAAIHERARIARDMHDILAHSLTALSVQLQATRQTVARDPSQTAHLLDEMAITLRQSVAESRQLVQVLREATTPEEEDRTLLAQLQRLTDPFHERTGLRIMLSEHGQARMVSKYTCVALRFIVQEALTNAYKHGNAHQLRITLDWQDALLALNAEDDGTPQTAQRGAGAGHGLQGMRERVEVLGGTVAVGPRASPSGFCVCVRVPYQSAWE